MISVYERNTAYYKSKKDIFMKVLYYLQERSHTVFVSKSIDFLLIIHYKN